MIRLGQSPGQQTQPLDLVDQLTDQNSLPVRCTPLARWAQKCCKNTPFSGDNAGSLKLTCVFVRIFYMQRKPIEIKISTVVAIAVILHDGQLPALETALQQLTANNGDYYSEECAVIDVGNIDCAGLDWSALIKLFKDYGFHPVAIRNAPEAAEEHISALGLSIDLGSKAAQIADLVEPEAPVAAAPAPAIEQTVVPEQAPAVAPAVRPVAVAPMIIDTPVRGGQRIYARGTDLVITAVVNAGAEVIADGNIHIYAPLRGRALAGASGNTGARIFTSSLEAELVSIAGIYRTFENGYPPLTTGVPIQIKLNGDKIDVVTIQSHT